MHGDKRRGQQRFDRHSGGNNNSMNDGVWRTVDVYCAGTFCDVSFAVGWWDERFLVGAAFQCVGDVSLYRPSVRIGG